MDTNSNFRSAKHHYVYDQEGHLIAEYGVVDKGGTPAWDVTREYVWAEGRLIGLLDYGYAKADPFDMASASPGKPVVYQVAALSLLAVPGLFLIFGVRRRGQKGYVAYVTFGALFASSFLIANAIPVCCPAPGTASIHPYFVLTGHLGQPLKVVDDLYNTKWQTWYTPFGNTMDLQEDGVTLNMRLPGQYYDGEISDYLGTDVYYNWHRYYMPEVGRYLQVDPIYSQNNFNYANNNPILFIDVLGLICTLSEVKTSIGRADTIYSIWLQNMPLLGGAQSLMGWILAKACDQEEGNGNACNELNKGWGCDGSTDYLIQSFNSDPTVRKCCEASKLHVWGGAHWKALLECEYKPGQDDGDCDDDGDVDPTKKKSKTYDPWFGRY